MILKSPTLRNSLYFFFSLLYLHACGLFTFSGGALRDDIKTFSIHFYTEVSDGPTYIVQKLTEALSTKILGMTCLTREEKDGDIQYEGGIKSFRYTTAFSSKNKDDDSIQEVQRLTITIEVSCLNPSDKECSFTKKQFSASADMPSTDNQLDKEPELIKEIFSKLVMDVCSKSIDNW